MSRWRILVVDDERELADYIGRMVQGFFGDEGDVEVFYSGTRALARLQEESFDLLLSDMVMPVTNGMKLLEYIAANRSETEVIFLTGYEEFDYIYKVNKLKKCSYIIKTEHESVITDALREAVERMEQRRRQAETVAQAQKQIAEVKQIFSEEKAKQMLSYEEAPENSEQRIIHKIREYVHAHIHEDITAATIAEVFHYSPAYLSKIYKNYGKEKLSTYIIAEKIKAAKKLLVESDKTVAQISAMLGYQSPQAFARAFRRELSMTPQEYRRAYRERYMECGK